jgi:hypothetical protein
MPGRDLALRRRLGHVPLRRVVALSCVTDISTPH